MISPSQPMMPQPISSDTVRPRLPTQRHARSFGHCSGSSCFAWLLLAACIAAVSGENYGQTPAASATPTAHPYIPTLEETAVSRLRTTAAAGNEATPVTQPHSDHGRSPATAVPSSACPNTPPLDEEVVSLMRNLSDDEKDKRLQLAARDGVLVEVRALLAAGADVESRDVNARRALHYAAFWGHVEAAQCLLQAGAEADARTWMQITPLHYAAEQGSAAVVRLLLAASADVNANDWVKSTPLHKAAKNGHVEAATVLLEKGADKGASDGLGKTPLQYARQNNHQQLIHLLEMH